MGFVSTVSVIIPTWNRSAALKRAVRSALSQSHPPLEVLVCDDGSTDDTGQVLRSIGDSRVVWLPGERGGRPAIPRNRGLSHSRGEWLAFLDDDDVWLPEKLEMQLLAAQSRSCQAVCSDAWRVTPDAPGKEPLVGGESRVLSFAEMLTANRVVCSSMLVRKDVVSAAAGFPEAKDLAAIEDYALWLRVADLAAIAYLASPLVDYNDDPKASIRNNRVTVFEQRQIVMNNFIDWKGANGCRCSLRYWRVKARLLLEQLSQRFQS
ncbi:MAG: hypothetical protein A2075_15635 [Geobacteraceae bacterium GWC2_58_44]|nr:MAG: hypothetical protein A2075_15635 [Geobacteraceae bacterium GWC2_58_44]HBG06016.1 hypothetical protein [Geobacter sp.]